MTERTLDNLRSSYNAMGNQTSVLPKRTPANNNIGSGSTARFSDNSQGINSEVAWSAFFKDLQKFFETHGTLPVNIEDYFPHDTNLLSTVGMLGNEAQQELMKHNLNIDYNPITGDHDYGIMKYSPKWLSDAIGYDEADSSLAITDLGHDAISKGQQSVDMHEYLHYIDALAGDITTGREVSHHKGSDPISYDRMSDVMKSYSNADGSPMTKDQLYDRWMNDPRTSHLDVEDPKDRVHHSGRNNPREGFGNILATALSDQGYKDNINRVLRSKEDIDYYLSGKEQFARSGGSLLRQQTQDEGFTKGLFQGLDRELANSLATLLNSR